MNSRALLAEIVVALAVIGVLVVYSATGVQPTVTTTATTTVFGQVNVISTTGSQAVLCTATDYFPLGIIIYTTTTVTHGRSTTVETSYPPLTSTAASSVFASAVNKTQPVGYVYTSTSLDSGYSGPAVPYTVMTCTYLP